MKGVVIFTLLFLAVLTTESTAKVSLSGIESVDVEFYCTNEKDARLIGNSFERDGMGGGNDPFEIGDEATWIPSDFPEACNGLPAWTVVADGPVTLLQTWRRKGEAMTLYRREVMKKAIQKRSLYVLMLGHSV
jgi:hypothetical protein